MAICLLDRFFSEECTRYVRDLLLEALERTSGTEYFTFNVFNVLIDADRGVVTVEDELDPSASCTTSRESFKSRLEAL